MKILYTVGTAPYLNTDNRTRPMDALPKALHAQGVDVRMIMPLDAAVGHAQRERMQFLLYTYVEVRQRRHCCRLFHLNNEGVHCYYVENETYFRQENAGDPAYEAACAALFAKAVVKMLPLMDWKPDVLHCVDWQTALVPVYLGQETAPLYRNIRTVFTLRSAEQQGSFRAEAVSEILDLPQSLSESEALQPAGRINLVKAAVQKADLILTVSPSFAMELREPGNVFALQRVMENSSHKLRGILGGIESDVYDPATDELTYCAFDSQDLSGKAVNKSELQRNLGLDMEPNKAVIACVSTLVREKGMDMVGQLLDFLIAHGAQLVLLGTGDAELEQLFVDAQEKFAGSVSANIMVSDTLARRIYAGADILLMPSRLEPDGQEQMIAMRYGTVPIVRQTGALKDSVVPYPAPNSNGFAFAYDAVEDMQTALSRALALWRTDSDGWRALMRRCMEADFSWSAAAREHLRLYEQLVG